MFSHQISWKQLALMCRSLSTMLHSGVAVLKAFDLAAGKSGDAKVKRVLQSVNSQLKQGDGIAEALRSQGTYFPELVIDMVQVAEQTGTLPEVLSALADHYEQNLKLRRDFIGQITMPIVQLVAAVFIVAGMIFLIGILPTVEGGLDTLTFGLKGTTGALTWLTGWAIGIAGLFVAYKLITANADGMKYLHQLFMRIPVVGGCMESFALARFSWALHLTQEAGMPIDDSLDASFKATSNGAFMGAGSRIIAAVQQGETLTDAFHESGLFPADFVAIVQVAETSGTVPEALHRLSPQFEEQARRSLSALTAALGWLIWMLVAGFIIFLVFRIALWYIGMINDAVKQANGV